MSRQARVDVPCAWQHINCRGLERQRIFWSDGDRDSFVDHLGRILEETSTGCLHSVTT